jgi:uncharacterized protein YbbK (DUF523 family)
MPIPTPQEIAAGFEGNVPTPQQAAKIQNVKDALIQAANVVAQNGNDNTVLRSSIRSIQQAYSYARSSIMRPADP